MRTIIAGSRDITEMQHLLDALRDYPHPITEVVSGGARGVDALGERFARECKIPLKCFYADWNTHGKAAGPIRNRQMAEYADALIAIWDGKSRGTANMVETAKKLGLVITINLI